MRRSRPAYSLDYFVGSGEQRIRRGEAEGLCGRQIDDQIELGRLLYWDVPRVWPCAMVQNPYRNVGLAVICCWV